MKTCALPFCPVGIMYEGVGDLASQISPVNKVTSLLSGFFAFSPANPSKYSSCSPLSLGLGVRFPENVCVELDPSAFIHSMFACGSTASAASPSDMAIKLIN